MNGQIAKLPNTEAPAVGLVAVNSISLLIGLYFLVATFIEPPDRFDLGQILLLLYLVLVVTLATIAIIGGAFMFKRRHYHFCVAAAAASMVCGFLGITLVVLNFPISLWSLHVLRRSGMAAAFDVSAPMSLDHKWLSIIRVIALFVISLLGIIATFGYILMVSFGANMSGAGAGTLTYRGWTPATIAGYIPALSFLSATLACLPIVRLRAIKFVAALSFLFMTPLFFGAVAAPGVFIPLAAYVLIMTSAAFFVIHTVRNLTSQTRL